MDYISRVPAWQRAIANRLTADGRSARERTVERDLGACVDKPLNEPAAVGRGQK